MSEPTIYEISVPERLGVKLPATDVPETPLPADLMRSELDLPEGHTASLVVLRGRIRVNGGEAA